jgi:hypothetical protein
MIILQYLITNAERHNKGRSKRSKIMIKLLVTVSHWQTCFYETITRLVADSPLKREYDISYVIVNSGKNKANIFKNSDNRSDNVLLDVAHAVNKY